MITHASDAMVRQLEGSISIAIGVRDIKPKELPPEEAPKQGVELSTKDVMAYIRRNQRLNNALSSLPPLDDQPSLIGWDAPLIVELGKHPEGKPYTLCMLVKPNQQPSPEEANKVELKYRPDTETKTFKALPVDASEHVDQVPPGLAFTRYLEALNRLKHKVEDKSMVA